MSDTNDSAQENAATVAPRMKFKDMSTPQKLAHVGKFVLCILTLGFAYPNIFVD